MNIKYRTACLVKLGVLACIFIGAAFAQTFPRIDTIITLGTAENQTMECRFNSRVGGHWLTVARHNRQDDLDGFHPSFTSITSSYKPIVRKLTDGRYEIEFVLEISKDLP